MKVLIWVDDIRPVPESYKTQFNNIISCKDFFTAKCALALTVWKGDCETYVSLGHDLGEDKTGYDIAKDIVEYELPIKGYRLHTSNPVGRDNMEQLLNHYGYLKF